MELEGFLEKIETWELKPNQIVMIHLNPLAYGPEAMIKFSDSLKKVFEKRKIDAEIVITPSGFIEKIEVIEKEGE